MNRGRSGGGSAAARVVAHHHKHAKAHHRAHHKAATGHHHKHHKAHKHHTAAKKHKGAVHRGLAIGADSVACCAAEALAASLRLSGLSVSDEEMLELFWRAGGDPDAGVPIVAALEAASESGLAGVRPAGYSPVIEFLDSRFPATLETAGRFGFGGVRRDDAEDGLPFVPAGQRDRLVVVGVEVIDDVVYPGHSLILGVDLPGPHTVLATPEGWWSWGELFCPWCDFPDAVVEEAWAVSWA